MAAAALAAADGSRPTRLTHLCPHCGLSGIHPIVIGEGGEEQVVEAVDDKLRKKIGDLEREVGRLTGKASAQADKLADAEDELRQLRALSSSPSSTADTTPAHTPPQPPRRPTITRKPVANAAVSASATKLTTLTAGADTTERPRTAPADPPSTTSPTSPTETPSPSLTTAAHLQSTLRRATSLRFSSFLRRPSSDTPPPVPTLDPAAALESEAQRRIAAETKLSQVNTELEDLSATLFEQANEMVATERRLRAEAETRYEERARGQEARIERLEARIKVLEERDKERTRRLENLEKGMRRIGRIRGMLGR